MNNRGMIPIVRNIIIILILVGCYFGYLEGLKYYLKTQIFQANSDVEMIVKKIKKWKLVQNGDFTDLMQLKASFLPSIDYLKDPWGNKYELDIDEKLVYSLGPDGKHSETEDETWDDDIYLAYEEIEDPEADRPKEYNYMEN